MVSRDTSAASDQMPESRGAFGGFIGPLNLLAQVRSAVPWLFTEPRAVPEGVRLSDLARPPEGWVDVLHGAPSSLEATETPTDAAWADYFTLCVAAHFATVASYVPTDVDTKIRDHLWFQIKDPEERGRMTEVALALSDWDISGVSRRLVHVPEVGIVSGHDGERLSVLAGGLLGLASAGDAAGTAAMEEAIDRELRREAAAFVSLERHLGGERDLLLLAATLTHNVGDVDQGLSARKGQAFSAASRERFGRLAHERPERYGGVFARAARLYRELMASEGHRHYPLRDVRPLRSHPDLLLPIGPFLDEWGERLATFEPWTAEDRGAAVAALVGGIRRVKGQVGYFRALAGFDRRHPGGLASTTLGNHLPASVRRGLKDKELRKRIAIQRTAFESGLAKEARRILGGP